MLRSMFISLSHVKWAQEALTRAPLARNVARRFIAGQTLPEAIDAIRSLNAYGINATLDCLGESVHERAAAEAARDEYLRAALRVRLSHGSRYACHLPSCPSG